MARILVVEDEDNIAMALEFLLARDGHAHSRHSQGGPALNAIRKARAPPCRHASAVSPPMPGW